MTENLLSLPMELQWTNFAILPLLSMVLSFFNAYAAWKSFAVKEGKIFLVYSLGIAIVSYGYLFELLSRNESWILFWDNFQFLGAAILIFYVFYFSLLLTKKYQGINRYLLKTLGVFLFICLFFIWTFPIHNFIRSNIYFIDYGNQLLVYDYGLILNIYNFVVLSVLVYSLVLIILQSKREPDFKKKQLYIFTFGLFIPLLGGGIEVFGLVPFIDPHLDLSPIYLSISNIIFFWGINYYQILKLLPFAREKLFENMKDAVVIVYKNNLIMDANLSFASILNKTINSLKNSDLRIVFPELYKLIVTNQTKNTINEWIYSIENYQFYYEISINKLSYINPFIKYIELRDVTFNKNLQMSLQHQMNFLNSIFTSTSQLFIVLNSEGEILLFNPASEKTFQIDISEVINKKFWEAFPDSKFPTKVKQNLRDILKDQEKFPISLLGEWTLKNGESVTIEWEINLNLEKNKTISSYILSGKEISINIKAEKKILNLENALDEINIQKNFIETQKNELEKTLEDLKNTQKQLVQSEKMAALGQLITGIAHEINNPIGAINSSLYNIKSDLDSLKNSNINTHEILLNLKDDVKELYLELKRDIESNLDPANYLNHRQKKKSTREFFEKHNINNSQLLDNLTDLNYFIIDEKYIELFKLDSINSLLKHFQLEMSINTNLRITQIAIEKVSKMLYALKNYSHINSNNDSIYTSLQNNIETVLMIYKSNLKDINLIKNYNLDEDIHCFPEDLIQVWTNIIYNALQALNFKGEIKINTYKLNSNAIVEIIDNGPGISKEDQEKIFLPFFTTKNMGEGTGIGLDITKRIIEKHEGKISVESEPGKTCFRIELPIKKN
jgi:PAS domain S-box-containing protein